ncbi:uncharacterized protein PHACADRAFT_253072 [Phanerochaete carnosa HHB-10118-sp]|uniref:Uncharacterized protein n=1 Tax=Phanerochaete carnosa (strain HHB-10118-sp) TaxID=650164 RepID=K5V773_PHACS|nr:uncharacterized protein PHACADRAFT_253072 [Phanerochaete carnosa HHB-10118-sp]EKM58611.1 hypothetical protein PHACADRAFT_253072 [Phanerochaete carnosa HHB-10118-sp]
MISDDESDDEPDDGLRTPPPVARAMPRVRASTLLSGSGLQLSVSPRSEPMSDSNEEALLEPLPLPDLSIPFEDSRAMNVGRMGGSRAWLSRKMIFGTGGPIWRSSQNVASTSAS